MDNDLLTLELPPDSTVKDLKGFIEAETAIPSTSQSLYLNGQPIGNDAQTLESAGVSDGEMLAVVVRRAQAPRASGQEAQGRSGQPDMEAVRQQVLANPQALAQLRENDAELAAAANDAASWRSVWTLRQSRVAEQEREHQELAAIVNADPLNLEAQQKMYEIIRQKNVVENLQRAYEQNPEGISNSFLLQDSRLTGKSFCSCPYALHQYRSQRRACEGLCRLWCSSDHHVPRLRREM